MSKFGGTLISASSDIIADEVEDYCYSNGNCELSTVEFDQLEIALMVLYRPSGKNFSLEKFQDIIEKVRTYLSQLRIDKPHFKIVLAGDFNFPREIVRWIRTDDGMIGDANPGNDQRKQAYAILSDLAIEFGLEQIVGTPTREDNILDLIYTDSPEIVTEPKVEILSPITDHNLVTCDIHVKNPTDEKNQQREVPEIKQFDFKSRDKDRFAERLRSIDWLEALGGIGEIKEASQRFTDTLV